MKNDVKSLISIRPGYENDRPFIMATWLRGLYYGNSWFKEIDKDTFMKNYHDVITDILKFQTTVVNVAAFKDDPDVVLGYAVIGLAYQKPILHWVFVKQVWRKLGIAQSLVPQDTDTATHMTAMGKKIKPKSMLFNPFLI